jgi:hemoglobin
MRQIKTSIAVLVFTASFLSGCGASNAPAPKNEPLREPGTTTLYDRLGGGPTVYALADNLIETTMADPRVNLERLGHQHQWKPTDDHVAELKMYWAQYLGMLADGPQMYEGRNMLDLHKGMQISQGEWDAFMEDFAKVLSRSQIAPSDQKDLLNRVAGTHDVIVDK